MKTTDKPTLQEFHIAGVKHIIPSDTLALLEKNEALMIDVREENEVRSENIPLNNVLYHPMSLIMERLAFIPKDQNIILGCPGGVRSTKVANLLNLQGYPNAANLDGGFNRWKAEGLPFEINLLTGGGCGCGSTSSADSEGACC